MKILFLSGAALAQYAPPTTKKPDDYTTGPRLPDQKGVQSINNCWGGEGPVYNPDYLCGAQYMINQDIRGKECVIEYSPSGNPGTFTILEDYEAFYSVYAGSGAYVVDDIPVYGTKFVVAAFKELSQAQPDGPSWGDDWSPIPINLKFKMPEMADYLYDNSTCCTAGTGDDESDSSDNFKITCSDIPEDEPHVCRLLENINADGTHNRYNFAVGGFDADNVKSIEVDLRDKQGDFYTCKNFRLQTPNGASCTVGGAADNIISCETDNFGQLNLWFGCDGINTTLGETEADQPSIWESAVSCDHFAPTDDPYDEDDEEDDNDGGDTGYSARRR